MSLFCSACLFGYVSEAAMRTVVYAPLHSVDLRLSLKLDAQDGPGREVSAPVSHSLA
jgi:hypothetical protein